MEMGASPSPQLFTVWIGRSDDGSYHTHAWSAQGEARGTLDISLLPAKLQPTREPDLPRRDLRSVSRPSGDVLEEEQGDRLYRALFSEQVRDLLQRSRADAESNHQNLQLSLQIDPADRQVAWLDEIDWELLRDPDQGFLGLHPGWTIVRYLHSPFRPEPPPPASPLRILVVVASPTGLPPLALGQELRELETAWRASGAVQVVLLQPPTLHALSRQLTSGGPFHLVHFMGHGTFDERTGKGYLLLEDDARGASAVEGQVLAAHLQSLRPPFLVVLNACRTAAGGPKPLSAVAAALVRRAAIPAVLAMKTPVLDTSAIDFSLALHEALAAGTAVDLAVTAGRRALHARQPDHFDWAIPSLYLRATRPQMVPQPPREPQTLTAEDPELRGKIVDTFEAESLEAEQASFTAFRSEGETAGHLPRLPASLVNSTRIGTGKFGKFDRTGVIIRGQGQQEPESKGTKP